MYSFLHYHVHVSNGNKITGAYSETETKKVTIKLLRTIVVLTQTLKPLPDDVMMTMKLLYYDNGQSESRLTILKFWQELLHVHVLYHLGLVNRKEGMHRTYTAKLKNGALNSSLHNVIATIHARPVYNACMAILFPLCYNFTKTMYLMHTMYRV